MTGSTCPTDSGRNAPRRVAPAFCPVTCHGKQLWMLVLSRQRDRTIMTSDDIEMISAIFLEQAALLLVS